MGSGVWSWGFGLGFRVWDAEYEVEVGCKPKSRGGPIEHPKALSSLNPANPKPNKSLGPRPNPKSRSLNPLKP